MANTRGEDKPQEDELKGTTLKVYRFMLRSKTPLGIHDVQRGVGLSSPSLAQYHLRKLEGLGLVREEQGGYVVDRVVFDNVIRIRRTTIPLQTAYVAFFAASLAAMLTVFRPGTLSPVYVFSLLVILVGLTIAAYETKVTLGHLE